MSVRGAMSARDTWRWLLAAAGRRAQAGVAALCVLQAVTATLSVCLAPVMQRAVDAATGGNAPAFGRMVAAFGLIILIQICLNAVVRHLQELTRSTLDNRLRATMLSGVLALSAREAQATHSAALMSRMTSDVQVVTDGIVGLAPSLVSAGIRIVGAIAVMFAIAPELAVVFVLVGLFMTGVSVVLRDVLKRRHRAVQEAESAMRCFLQECLENLLVVHAFGAEGKMARANGRNMAEHRRQRMRKNAVSNLGSTGFSLVIQGGYVLGFVWCGYGILAGTMTYGMLTAVIQLVGQLSAPFANLGGMFSRYASLLSSAERLMEVAPTGAVRGEGDAAAGARGATGREQVAALIGLERIVVDGVDFSYGDDPVLSGASLAVEAGTMVAVVGSSGAGKSTLLRLVLGAYEPDAGLVRLEGAGPEGPWSMPASQASPGAMAYVPQGNGLLAGTVREAVALAAPGEPDDERVAWACRAACADGFVEALPQGYATELGERGAGLSEGQAQRLAVARALYAGAPVLLLDEATSALDAGTEARLLENLRNVDGLTVLVATHRAEAVRACDRAVHVADGKIAEVAGCG